MTTKKTKNTVGEFGEQFTQFKDRPVEAIKFLKRYGKKNGSGECLKAIKVPGIGYVDFVWGENDKNNKGYGLKHIIEKHGKDIEALDYQIEQFIPFVLTYGDLRVNHRLNRYIFENENFRVVISSKHKDKKKQWLLTAFDIKNKTAKRRSKK